MNILVGCSFLWELRLENGIKISQVKDGSGNQLHILRAVHDAGKSITVALSEDAHVAVLQSVDATTAPLPEFKEWIVRLADGISVTGDTVRHVIALKTDLSKNIVSFRMAQTAEIAFLASPVPNLLSRDQVHKAPADPVPTGT